MAYDMIKLVGLVGKSLGHLLPHIVDMPVRRLAALRHGWTWENTPEAKNVVVVGGSFAGVDLVQRLADSLPMGYKVVWIEKNSHLNFTFAFPRFSVVEGQESKVFIPYDGVARGSPAGILTRIQDTAIGLTDQHVLLASGEKVEYAYLAMATGTSQPPPVQVRATERADACLEMRGVQEAIRDSRRIAVVGGGAVGVELAGDIAAFHTDKEVTLIHSRENLMSRYGAPLRDHVLKTLRDELGIRVLLSERPKLPSGGRGLMRSATLEFSDGHEEEFDLVIRCTGQQPNSALMASLHPSAVSSETSRILVRPTLQVRRAGTPDDLDLPIFALGDVAEHGGPQMARAAQAQAGVAAANILAMIAGQVPARAYKPDLFIEAAIKLTLGKKHVAIYTRDTDGSDILVPLKNGPEDMDIGRAWSMFGADIKQANEPPAQPPVQPTA